jgi:hypothetical protein
MVIKVDRGRAELIRDGKVVEVREFGNIVPTIGFELICKAVGGGVAGAGTPAAKYLAIGTGVAAPALTDTALGGELGRGLGSFAFPTGSKYYTMQKNFPAGTATGAVTESGCLNKTSGGAILNRGTFAVINKGASDTLRMTWKIQFS